LGLVSFCAQQITDHVTIRTWDAPANDTRLNAVLETLARQLGFSTFLVTRQQRLAPTTEKCGALAIHFLRSALHGLQLPVTAAETDLVHAKLRQGFTEILHKSEFVVRPWIWGSGDEDGDTEENALAEQEIPFCDPSFQDRDLPSDGPIGRIFDVFSPQSDPDLVSEVSDDSPRVVEDSPPERSRSRSPRPNVVQVIEGVPVDAMPAPDADGLSPRESGPLPIMPDGRPLWRDGTLVFQVRSEIRPVQFARDPGDDRPGVSLSLLFDVGAYSRELWNRVEWSVAELVALDPNQMLQVIPPVIENPTKLWSVRNQVLSARDRLSILENQLGVMADDEILFHLEQLDAECLSGDEFPPKRIGLIEPIVAAAWLDPNSFDCTDWAATHPEIRAEGIQLVGAFCVDSHWIPVLLTPWGDNARISSFDATGELNAKLASILTRVAHALGFTEIHFDHIPRTFASKSVRGAVSINFLRSEVAGFPRLGATFSAWEEHHVLRRKFIQYRNRSTEVKRPWLWGFGLSDDEVQDNIFGQLEGYMLALSWPKSKILGHFKAMLGLSGVMCRRIGPLGGLC